MRVAVAGSYPFRRIALDPRGQLLPSQKPAIQFAKRAATNA